MSSISAGTTSGTALVSTGDTTGTLDLKTGAGATTALSIDASQRVGIGTSSPDALLTVNTIASFGDGAVTTPSIAHKGDLNTGIWFPAADTIAASTGGSERLRIDSSGNVGIGTTSPGQKLHVNTSSGSSYIQLSTGSNANLIGYLGANSGASTVELVSNSTYPLVFATNGAERARIDSSGNVGIGGSPSTATRTTVQNCGSPVGYWVSSGVMQLQANAVYNSGDKFVGTGYALYYAQDPSAGAHVWSTSSASGTAGNAVTYTERMRIDSSGNVGIGTSSPTNRLSVAAASAIVDITSTTGTSFNGVELKNTSGSFYIGQDNSTGSFYGAGAYGRALYSSGAYPMVFFTNAAERMRIDSSGAVLAGTTSASISSSGLKYEGANGALLMVRDGNTPFAINRLTNDGNLIEFYQDTSLEGTISVSGTTVSYNGGHLARWSQTTDNTRIPLVKGTVMSNLDQMANWDGQANEQLNCMKVSDVEGDVNVAGVFVNWDNDDDEFTNDMNIAMTGDMIIRIAQGTVVQRGDLLMSAGDGTAKPQGDDIVRSKTVAKVTSTHITCTYDDGSYCVPCVLMAC